MKFGLNDTIIEAIQKVFEINASIDEVIVFGSRAKGNYKEGSDIDLAVKGRNISFDDILKLHGQLDDLNLPYKIDLLDCASNKEPALKEHIDRVGIVFYERWKNIKFGQLLERPVRNGLYKKKEFHGKGVKIVNMGELFAYPRLSDVGMKRIELTEKEKKKFLLRNGDLLFARRSLTAEGAGKCSLVYNITEETTFESSIIQARPDSKSFSSEFIYYYFNSPYGKYLLNTILRQVAVSGITGTDLMDLVIKIPDKNLQTTISGIFSSLDDKIDLLQRQNKTLEQLAETLFRQWFVEEDNDFEEKSLDKIAEFLNGLACQKYPLKSNEEGLPVIKIRELRAGITDNSDIATNDIPAKYLVKDGDMLFSWSGSLDVVLWSGGKGVLNQHLFKVSSNDFPQWFYYLWVKRYLPEFQAIAENKATTMGHIQRHHLTSAMVLVPSKNKLREMDETVSPLFQKIKINSQQIKALTKLRDALLPKLISGEVRVN